ncbi:LOW QUALITY PROTEIN: E3 ubiquitin-protein ligase BIG BROTHER [Brassica napus]|uniref:LOW QUALITY PROTEIN: E3 ubiquitin-protein ligase BIG BROTHER n=1 Tax=Brassica napus TaxID=3708 RepID=UPI002079CC40|nr:LOW QUALITY PROTEIN: E3 ubiquitin-protein ligase BIG BROTHER [Brassica napus]
MSIFTSGGFSGYGYSNSSPDRYTVGLNFPDIGSSSRHDDSKVLNEITESVREVNRGLPQWKISRLPTHTYGETPTCGWWWEKKKRFVADDSQCSICLVDYENGDKIATLTPCKCNHIYHKDCISEWLKKSTVCCVCKRQVRC